MSALDAPSPTLRAFDTPFAATVAHLYGNSLYDIGAYSGSRPTVPFASAAALRTMSSAPALTGFSVAATTVFTASPGWGSGGWGLTGWGGGVSGTVAGAFTTAPSFHTFSSSPTLAVLI